MSLNEQLQEVHSQSFGTENKVLSNFSVDNASTADNKVIHKSFAPDAQSILEKFDKAVKNNLRASESTEMEQPEQEEQGEQKEFLVFEGEDLDPGIVVVKTTKKIHELIKSEGRDFKTYQELEEMDPSDRKSLSTDKAFPTQKQFLAFLARHNLTKQFCTDVNQQLTVMELCWRYQTAYELMRNVAKELQTPFKAPTKEKPKKKLPDNFLLAEMVGKISNLEQQIKELRGEHTVLNKIVRDVSELIVVTHDKLGEIRKYSEMRWDHEISD
jgi:hypothetical protein